MVNLSRLSAFNEETLIEGGYSFMDLNFMKQLVQEYVRLSLLNGGKVLNLDSLVNILLLSYLASGQQDEKVLTNKIQRLIKGTARSMRLNGMIDRNFSVRVMLCGDFSCSPPIRSCSSQITFL